MLRFLNLHRFRPPAGLNRPAVRINAEARPAENDHIRNLLPGIETVKFPDMPKPKPSDMSKPRPDFGPVIHGIDLSKLPPSENAATSKYIYIEGRGQITHPQQRELASLGVNIVRILGEEVCLCSYEPADLAPVRNLPYIKKANVYPKELKMDGRLGHAVAQSVTFRTGNDIFPVSVILWEGGDRQMDQVVEKSGLARKDMAISRRQDVVSMRTTAKAIIKILELDNVRMVERNNPLVFYNDHAREDLRVFDVDEEGSRKPSDSRARTKSSPSLYQK